ncbi:MAG: hypothetical protein K8T90_02545 [Planctomycetes bacterium]|nr:hypothetical protein [Planctomycetota bacterium]
MIGPVGNPPPSSVAAAACVTADPLVAVARHAPMPPGGFAVRRKDYGAFRAMEPGTDDVLLLRPAGDGLRIERPAMFETVAWSDVTGVVLTAVRIGGSDVSIARIEFRQGPSLDLADVYAPGADSLPMSIEAGGPPLIRVERLRMVVGAVIAASGLSPRSRSHFHRGGRGVPVPDLTPRPRRLPLWAPPVLVVASIVFLIVLFPALSLGSVIAIHLALLVHELGHAVAMRRVGIEVRGILFLPLLGAGTVAEHPFRTRWHDVIVALSGPFTGLPIAIATIALCDGPPPEPVRWGLVVSVAYNVLNLLPFAPMDGGRVLVAVLAGLPQVARTIFTWAPVAVGIGVLFLLGPGEATIGLMLLLAVAIVTTRLSLRRLDFHQWVLDVPIDPSALRAALRDVTWGFGTIAREDVDGGVPATPMDAPRTLVAIAVYLALFAAMVAVTLALLPLVPEITGG